MKRVAPQLRRFPFGVDWAGRDKYIGKKWEKGEMRVFDALNLALNDVNEAKENAADEEGQVPHLRRVPFGVDWAGRDEYIGKK